MNSGPMACLVLWDTSAAYTEEVSHYNAGHTWGTVGVAMPALGEGWVRRVVIIISWSSQGRASVVWS
jgi:hypothetical protein